MSTKILEEVIYKENKEQFELYGIGDSHIQMIKDMIERSDEFVS